MTKPELEMVLEEGESYKIEFKRSVSSDLPKEMVAFANASGGRIFIGIDDNNKIVGTDISNQTLSQVEDMALACDPPVRIKIEKNVFQKLLVIHVPEGGNKPYRCNKGFYLRNGANSQKMTTSEITDFIQAEGKIRFDEQLRQDLDWNKYLSVARLNHFLKLSGIKNRHDRKMLILNLGVGSMKKKEFFLNQAGILFFSKEPTLRLFHVSVVCALYKGTGKAVILDRKELTGSIIENIEEALLFLKRFLNMRQEISGMRRQEIWEIPEVALREAIVNAVCHRDYLEKGAQVMVEIFDDRIEITNPGGLPKGLSEKDFGKRSICRNPLIASLLHRSGYIEKMGTGISRIREALSQAKCPKVKISFDSFFCMSFPRPSFTKKGRENFSGEKTPPKTLLETPPETPLEKRGKKLGRTSEEILKVLRETPYSTIDVISKKVGKSRSAIIRAIGKLQESGILKRIGAKKSGSWKIVETPE